jgi:dUTP pyrophosphatase
MFGKGKVIPLSDINLRKLGLGNSSEGLRGKIYVQCQRCNEVFLREQRNLHQFHACPTHIIRNGVKLKWCNKCKSFLTYEQFDVNDIRHDKLSSLCKICANQSQSFGTPMSWFASEISKKRSECKESGIPFDICLYDLLKIYEQQCGLCAYGGIMLEFGTNSLRSAFIERVDPEIGYVKGNIILVSKAMNWTKNNASLDDFLEFLLEISEWTTRCPVRLEFIKTDKDAVIPRRSRTTDAGYDIVSIEDITIEPNIMTNVRTGIIVCAPPGYYFTIEGRSSLWMKGVMPFRGIIDATYQGQLMVAMTNGSDSPYNIRKGDRIAQIILHRALNIDFNEVREFTPVEEGRGEAGFGSSGK